VTSDEVRARLDALRAIAGDDEAAHAEEDNLRADVLGAIQAGAPNPQQLAWLALKTSDIEFERWCA